MGVCARTHSPKLFNLWTCFVKDAKDSMQVVDAFTVHAVRSDIPMIKHFSLVSRCGENNNQQKKKKRPDYNLMAAFLFI